MNGFNTIFSVRRTFMFLMKYILLFFAFVASSLIVYSQDNSAQQTKKNQSTSQVDKKKSDAPKNVVQKKKNNAKKVDSTKKSESVKVANKKKVDTKKANKKSVKPKSPYESESDSFVAVNEIDNIVARNLKLRSLKPARLCSDAVYIRRVHIDLCGTIPDEKQTRLFIADKSPDKYAKLVDSLLASEKFTYRMTMRFGDIFRIKAEFPVNLWPNAAQAYSRYIFKSIADNESYAKMIEKMLVSEGSNFRNGEVNFFRAMQSKNSKSIASCVALSLMGMRFEKMSEADQHNLSAFFERLAYKSTKEWKEEIVYNDPTKRTQFIGMFPDASTVSLASHQDPREAFAKWLTKKGNPYFSKAITNRIWYWVFGQPIVSPVDDMFSENKPANAELLNYLAKYFESTNFDIRKLCKHIVLSRVYRQSFIPRCEPNDAKKYFAVYPVSRIDAEALVDIICQITNSAELYESTTPEPYTKFPAGESAVALPDGSITTSFLELFGKPSRDTGLDSERVCNPSASQKLHMINSRHIRSKIERSPYLQGLYKLGGDKFLNGAYLAILNRYPTPHERASFFKIQKMRTKKERHAVNCIDFAWGLFNCEEFINRH